MDLGLLGNMLRNDSDRYTLIFWVLIFSHRLTDSQRFRTVSEDTSTFSVQPNALKRRDCGWKVSLFSNLWRIPQLPSRSLPCECSYLKLSSQSWAANNNHQTGVLLPYIPNSPIQALLVIDWRPFSGLLGLNQPHRFVSMVYRFCSPVATSKAKTCSHPIHYAWDRADQNVEGHCINVDNFFIGHGSVDAFINFLIFVLVCSQCLSPWWTIPVDTLAADTAFVAPSHYRQTESHLDSSLHLSWLVSRSADIVPDWYLTVKLVWSW